MNPSKVIHHSLYSLLILWLFFTLPALALPIPSGPNLVAKHNSATLGYLILTVRHI
jgi:hypothetical protein